MTNPVDRAAKGRKLLEEWKAKHGQSVRFHPYCDAAKCDDVWPCPTARLIAAVEEALAGLPCEYDCKRYVDQCSHCQTRDAILSTLQEVPTNETDKPTGPVDRAAKGRKRDAWRTVNPARCPVDACPASGEVGSDYKSVCPTCGKRVAITVRGLYTPHKKRQEASR